MWHDRGAENTRRQKDAFRVGKMRDKGIVGDESPVRMAKEKFDYISKRDDGQETCNNGFKRAEAISFKSQDEECDDRGQDACQPKRQAEKQVERHGCSQEFRQIGRHSHDFHQSPHCPNNPAGKMFATVLSQVLPSGNAQFGRESLQKHGHQVAGQNDP